MAWAEAVKVERSRARGRVASKTLTPSLKQYHRRQGIVWACTRPACTAPNQKNLPSNAQAKYQLTSPTACPFFRGKSTSHDKNSPAKGAIRRNLVQTTANWCNEIFSIAPGMRGASDQQTLRSPRRT